MVLCWAAGCAVHWHWCDRAIGHFDKGTTRNRLVENDRSVSIIDRVNGLIGDAFQWGAVQVHIDSVWWHLAVINGVTERIQNRNNYKTWHPARSDARGPSINDTWTSPHRNKVTPINDCVTEFLLCIAPNAMPCRGKKTQMKENETEIKSHIKNCHASHNS